MDIHDIALSVYAQIEAHPFELRCRIVAALHCCPRDERPIGPHQVVVVHSIHGETATVPLRGFLEGHGEQFVADLASIPDYDWHKVQIVVGP